MSVRKPSFWKARKAWYVNTSSGRVFLAENEDDAYRQWRRLADLEERASSPDPTFSQLANDFLDEIQGQVTRKETQVSTFANYGWYLDRFVAVHGDMPASKLLPNHITDWLATRPTWGSAARRHAIGSLKRVLKWAFDEGRIPRNPLAGMKRPSQRRREQLVATDVHSKLVMAAGAQKGSGRIDRQFRLALIAIRHCGGRPQDVSRMQVEFVDPDVTKWTLPEHKTRRHTDQPRVVYLSPCLATITRILMAGRDAVSAESLPWRFDVYHQRVERVARHRALSP